MMFVVIPCQQVMFEFEGSRTRDQVIFIYGCVQLHDVSIIAEAMVRAL